MEMVLTQADLVKFAKMSPAPEGPMRDFEVTYTLVQTVRDREIERQEEERKRLAKQAESESSGHNDSSGQTSLHESADTGSNRKRSEAKHV